MKTNKYPALVAALTLIAIAFGISHAAEFSAPESVHTNHKLARTESSLIVWKDAEAREWLRVQGNDKATTLDEQWGPRFVSIETTIEPKVARTATGWIIVFAK